MADYSVFVIESVIGTGVVGSLKETCHFVLVEVHHTDIAVVIIIIHVICTCFAVCSFFSVHIILRYVTPQGHSDHCISAEAFIGDKGHISFTVPNESGKDCYYVAFFRKLLFFCLFYRTFKLFG